MASEVIMPALGMAQETGRIVAWLKKEGDSVERGDPIMEIETDKTTVEIEANASGTLANVTAQAGDDVPVGEVIALILAPGEEAPAPQKREAADSKQNGSTTPVAASEASEQKGATPVAMRMAQAHGIDVSRIPSGDGRITKSDVEAYIDRQQVASGRVLASPKARRLASEAGINLAQINGSGPEGAVLAADVLNFEPEAPVPQQAAQSAQAGTTQTGQMWRRMAERLTESWQTVPHFYVKRDVSAEGLIAWRQSVMSRSEIKVTFTDLLVKLVAAALREHPHVNGRWTGETVAFNEAINVGLAVAVDEGLIVPVIHAADTLGVVAIAGKRKEIVERSLQGKLRPGDLMDGTFTISNLGMYGIDEFTAIVNPPQAAILAVGGISERAIPENGQVVIRPMMTLSLSCDHRAVDGARGAQFLDTLANLIEEPLGLMD